MRLKSAYNWGGTPSLTNIGCGMFQARGVADSSPRAAIKLAGITTLSSSSAQTVGPLAWT